MSRIIPNNTVIVDPVTGDYASVGENNSLDVNVSDQTTRALDLIFGQQAAVTTLAANVSPGDTSINLTSATGFADGNGVGIFSGVGRFFFGEQVGAPVGNVITLDRQVDDNFLSGENVRSLLYNMNVSGSLSSPEIFQIGPVGGSSPVAADITRIIGYIQDNIVMDDAKFGGISALTNGIQLRRKNDATSDYTNYWNAKTNGGIALIAFDTVYTEKAPAGSYGLRFRNTYGGQEKHGVVIRLKPNDILEVLIQDDLTALEIFFLTAQGHVTTTSLD